MSLEMILLNMTFEWAEFLENNLVIFLFNQDVQESFVFA